MSKKGTELERLTEAEIAKRLLDPAAQGEGSEISTLLLLDRGQPDDARLARVLAAAAQEHPDRLRAARVDAREILPRLQAWQAARKAVDSFHFGLWPVAALFRGGRLITTFHPRRVFFDDRLQEPEERAQLEVFLGKMVFYDPSQVKEQKNLAVEAGG